MCVEERREAEVEPAVVEVPENGWEDFLFFGFELSEYSLWIDYLY